MKPAARTMGLAAALVALTAGGCEKLIGLRSSTYFDIDGGAVQAPADAAGSAADRRGGAGGGGGKGGSTAAPGTGGINAGSGGGGASPVDGGPKDAIGADLTALDAGPSAQDGGAGGATAVRDAAANNDGAVLFSATTGALVVRHSGKCLDIRGPITAAGNQGLKQTACDGSTEQTFVLKKNADGTFEINLFTPLPGASVDNPGCLDNENFSLNNGTNVIAYFRYNGTSNQKWIRNDVGDGYFKLSNQLSGRCLEVFGSQLDDTAPIEQSDCQDDPDAGLTHQNQMWKLVPAR